jgi:GTP-binding protein EngB required for normal cell division
MLYVLLLTLTVLYVEGWGKLVQEENSSKNLSVSDVCQDETSLGDLEFTPAIRRNILFVGKSGTGKSTIIKMLEDPNSLTTIETLESRTRNAELSTFSVSVGAENINLNIIDTPGLFDVKNIDSERLTNDMVAGVIGECVKNEITKVEKIYFVMQHSSNVNQQDFESLELFLKMFAGAEAKTSIIISFAQIYTPSDKELIKKMYLDFPLSRDLFERTNGDVFFAGALDHRLVDSADISMRMKSNIKEMRIALLKDMFCTSGNIPVSILSFDAEDAERKDRMLKDSKERAKILIKKDIKEYNNEDGLFVKRLLKSLYKMETLERNPKGEL